MSGYGDAKRRRDDRSTSRSPVEKRHKGKKEKKEKHKHRDPDDPRSRKRAERSRSRRREEDAQADPPSGDEAILGRTLSKGSANSVRGAWREEMKGEGEAHEGIEAEEDEEEVERKLKESRARREALIAKWVNRGEGGNNGTSGTLETPDTPMGEELSESDGEVSDAENRQPADGKAPVEDEETLKARKDLVRFIINNKAEHDNDMFNEEADEEALKAAVNVSDVIGQTGASAEDWDDREGYYKAKIGEVMAGRYLVIEDVCGKGVFSAVCKAKDQNDGSMVAIKVMRCNDMMRKAAEKEVEVLERLNRADRGNKRHVIRLMRNFVYRGHLCLVFECMWDNLRVALKKYTKDRGMSLQAVRAYTKQLLIALRHIHRCNIIHADIKPDNILISAGHNVVKICDLGSAMDLTEVDTTPYLVSRFYRAPEIVLGMKYGCPCDTFAMGCTLFEIFTGKILFPGRTNNDMLRLFMEVKGKMPHKMIKSGMLWKQHFDENLDFKFVDKDKATRKQVMKTITDCSQKRPIMDMVLARVGPEKTKSSDTEDMLYVKKAKQFAQLMDQLVTLNPESRLAPNEALQDRFLTEAGPGSKPKAAPAKGEGKGGGKGR